MVDIVLQNKPLVEAIFELRWSLQKHEGFAVDPHYKLLIGRVFDKVKDVYSYHQQLPAATIPDQMASYVVQHRFRVSQDGWPLIQLGPGIVTLNDTESYVWPDFSDRISELLDALYDVYPDSDNSLKPIGLLLRYIDAVKFNFENDDIFTFLEDQLKTKVRVFAELFQDTGVESSPLNFDLRFTFPISAPEGAVHLRFAKGMLNGEDALVWETQVQSIGEHVPGERNDIKGWVDRSHDLTHDWFFKMIEGNLLERFQ